MNSLRHIATEPANLHITMMEDKIRDPSPTHSDSDLSVGTTLSQESSNRRALNLALQQKNALKNKPEWEILEGLKEGQRFEGRTEKREGYLLKRRKWPLKGWHKRYFCLEKGILTYSKSSTEMAKGKVHGTVDVGLSVISTRARGRRIDIDADEFIYHLKVKNRAQFQQWIMLIHDHRLYRQHELSFGSKEAPKISTPVEDVTLRFTENLSRDGMRLARSPLNQPNRVAAWILDSAALDQGNRDLGNLQEKLFQLGSLMQKLELLTGHLEASSFVPNVGSTTLRKERKRFHLRKNKKLAKNASQEFSKGHVEIVVSQDGVDSGVTSGDGTQPLTSSMKDMGYLSTSHPALNTNLSQPEISRTSLQKCQEDYLSLAKEIHGGMKTMLRSIQTERERLKQHLENEGSTTSMIVTSLKNSVNQALQQNAELRSRLQKIHDESSVNQVTVASPVEETTLVHQPLQPSLSHESSSVLSNSEFFDALDIPSNASTSSEASLSDEDGSFISEVSDDGTEYTPAPSVTEATSSSNCTTGRRVKLPVPLPETGDFSLWNILCKNIGKDLSKISMPVTLNEPLNILQRLCEEMEYSELVDKAAELDSPYERMVYMAAFAVSSYASSFYRAGHKPFNPILGETYECIREDRGFRFISEQVSHHPPLSVCYAESKNFIFTQDIRVKTKFWGKSMEIIPIGNVRVHLPRTDDSYQWNKVTACIHNLFSGQRWVDQYGEMNIVNTVHGISCKLTFVKASYWSSKRHEVYGTIIGKDGETVSRLFGKWTEALYCGVPPTAKCIWRPGAMPEDYELYYGFTRFAIELNELDPETAKLLPPTDTRFRSDQRLLEEGNVTAAENIKILLEQTQRERRKAREENGIEYVPMWFEKDEDSDEWVYTHQYWEKRSNPGFVNIDFPEKIWNT